jgi:hypothetical protein
MSRKQKAVHVLQISEDPVASVDICEVGVPSAQLNNRPDTNHTKKITRFNQYPCRDGRNPALRNRLSVF